MKNKNDHQQHASELRRCAEESTWRRNVLSAADIESISPEEICRAMDELQMQKIELEMQNEELLRVQTELHLARERYFNLYDLAPVGYCTLNERGIIIEANNKAATLLGMARDDLVGQPLTSFIVNEDQDLYYLYRRNLLQTPEMQTADLRMMRSDKTIFWVRMQTVLGTVNSIEEDFYRMVLTDITAQKEAEDLLRKSKVKYRSAYTMMRTLVKVIPDMIWLKDQDGVYINCNPAFERFFGAAREDIVGKTDYDFVDKELAEFFRYHDRKALETGIPCSNEEWLTFADDGHQAIFDTIKIPMFDGDGKLLGVLGIARDITGRKQTEDALQASLAEKEVLLREVHHRVKNNMAAIVGLFNLQRQAMNDPRVQTVLAELSSRVRAMSLVHEKLYRSESLHKIDFQDYLQSLISHLRTSFGSSSGIRCEIAAQGVEMPLDLAVPCGMIINELVTNALKYAFPDTARQTVEHGNRILVAMCHKNGTFNLSVEDNGVGLAQGFDLRNVQTLGLVLVRMLGEYQLGGRLEVDQSNGTRFILTFVLRNKKKADD